MLIHLSCDPPRRKFVLAGRQNQHAGRARYPERAATPSLQCDLFEQGAVQADAREEIFEREVFVRSVRPAVGQREAEEQCLRAEDALKSIHDRDAAAFADERHVFARKRPLQRAPRGETVGGIRIGHVRLAGVAGGDFELHAARTMRPQMRAHFRENFRGLLLYF